METEVLTNVLAVLAGSSVMSGLVTAFVTRHQTKSKTEVDLLADTRAWVSTLIQENQRLEKRVNTLTNALRNANVEIPTD